MGVSEDGCCDCGDEEIIDSEGVENSIVKRERCGNAGKQSSSGRTLLMRLEGK